MRGKITLAAAVALALAAGSADANQTVRYGPPNSIQYASLAQVIEANGSDVVEGPVVCEGMRDVERMLRSATGSRTNAEAFQSFRDALEFNECAHSTGTFRIVHPLNFVTPPDAGEREFVIFGGMAKNVRTGRDVPIIWTVDFG